jgi:hypothetical protein
MALPFKFKSILKVKEELWKTQIFHHAKIYQSSKNPLKETENPSIYYNSITYPKF